MGSLILPWLFGKRASSSDSAPPGRSPDNEELRLEEFGVTPPLREFVKSFTVDTFKDSPIPDEHILDSSDPSSAAANVRNDLTEWQERHAVLVLSKVKEISHLRYVLCPRHLKEKQFWRIYFVLVKRYVAPYEIRAIQKAKLARMGLENEKPVDNGAIEVEMTAPKKASGSSNLPGPNSEGNVDGSGGEMSTPAERAG